MSSVSGFFSTCCVRTRGASEEGAETLVVVANEDIDQRVAPDVLLRAWNLPSTEATRMISRRS